MSLSENEGLRAAQNFWDKYHEFPVAFKISMLPDRQNQCITKFLFDCKTAKEIASELDVSVRTVEIHLRGAIRRLHSYRPEKGRKADNTRRILNDYYLGL